MAANVGFIHNLLSLMQHFFLRALNFLKPDLITVLMDKWMPLYKCSTAPIPKWLNRFLNYTLGMLWLLQS